MADAKDVIAYSPDQSRKPWLWKAMRCFESAEVLRDEGRLDCAVNRYYFATVHVAFNVLFETPNKWAMRKYRITKKPGQTEAIWPKGKLARAYWENHDPKAEQALRRILVARVKADYKEPPVQEDDINSFLCGVCDMIVGAMKSEHVRRSRSD